MISAFALLFILTGLSWANGWGAYFNKGRTITHTSVSKQDWSTSRAEVLADRVARNKPELESPGFMPGMLGMDHSGHIVQAMTSPHAYARAIGSGYSESWPGRSCRDHACYAERKQTWTIKPDAQNRSLRDLVQADPETGAVLSRKTFNQGMMLDRLVGVGIDTHEGQMFGWVNQLMGLAVAMGLNLPSVSVVILWWRRRHAGVLGAPVPTGTLTCVSAHRSRLGTCGLSTGDGVLSCLCGLPRTLCPAPSSRGSALVGSATAHVISSLVRSG